MHFFLLIVQVLNVQFHIFMDVMVKLVIHGLDLLNRVININEDFY
jgi:hypothetical protein